MLINNSVFQPVEFGAKRANKMSKKGTNDIKKTAAEARRQKEAAQTTTSGDSVEIGKNKQKSALDAATRLRERGLDIDKIQAEELKKRKLKTTAFGW
jgi:hypothetical protein